MTTLKRTTGATKTSGGFSPFVARHIGPNEADQRHMLNAIGMTSLEALIAQTIPAAIRQTEPLDMPEGIGEEAALRELAEMMGRNTVAKAMIGQGYHGTIVPPVIQRNLLENPGWYTAYTPYQPEISQGRLEMLFHFQTLVSELTGLPVANASLLDEATAVAEAVGVAYRHSRSKKTKVFIANALHPQTLDVLNTRLGPMGLDFADQIDGDTCAVIMQVPNTFGAIDDRKKLIAEAKEAGALVIVAADPLALVMMEEPAHWGADMCVGSMQRFGVPLGNGGPHAAYFATTEALTRLIPGRIIGQSIDAHGRPAYRLALQTREQHIRREKATSNICTAQALLANMAAAFAIWHGPDGLKEIAERVHGYAARFAAGLAAKGYALASDVLFDTVTVTEKGRAAQLVSDAMEWGIAIRAIDADRVSVAFDETTTPLELAALCQVFEINVPDETSSPLPSARNHEHFLTQEIFHACRSETEMMRLLRKLMDKDLALDRAMIPLGSCTMKLNAAAEMMPVSWELTSNIHPFSPDDHRAGYAAMIDDLDRWLSSVTGFSRVSFQPNAGSQGEYAGLLAIRSFHEANGESYRDICLIPSSAHGTNPASAQMAGYDVVVVKCNDAGDVSLKDLHEKLESYGERLAALMITYPSTHGVFEARIKEICDAVHAHGGQVYLDGANLNAMVGLARPGDVGADVCHLNLHKTFCIPHGGGGPGVGPIGVARHLVAHLPGHVEEGGVGAVSAAPVGSASILPITWMYMRMMGGEGLAQASRIAILSANYIAARLRDHYPILFTGENDCVAHECIIDTRIFKDRADVSVDDVAKRLIDYGFHAPTMSWPVAGTLMVEPTESEPLAEIDRFVGAMIAIAEEVGKIEKGVWEKEDNPMRNAPHTAEDLMADEWNHGYSRTEAAFPVGVERASKFWPPVSRVDNVHGDRNLVCTCPPIEELAVG
ncbi:aminomethyl-transferring glycine dehydrogenase [Pseudahrensia aquimaris]|uniref:Glycine dehydrogenase (decarboxylating) n=1 Tax=Pseudahrensia aquimaris TaxID=744461 RepID=A0ABW3FNJ8_9HYPH